MPRIFVTRAVPGVVDVPNAEVVVAGDKAYASHQQLLNTLRANRPFEAVVTMAYDRVDDSFLDACGPELRTIANFAVGYENIDRAACAKRGVVATITRHATTEGAADMAWTLLLAAARRLHEAGQYARSDAYPHNGPLGMTDFLGQPIAGRTLLIVGCGAIGRAVALRSLGWGMRCLYVARSRHYSFEQAPINGTKVELDEGLKVADFVSVHTPLTDETRHIINAQRLALMKPTAVIVSTARGPCIDEQALVDALKKKQIWGAGLDVFENEPEVHPGLKTLPNAVLTPHIGSASVHTRELMSQVVSANLRAVFEGREPPFPVPALVGA